jgi:predicted aconitase with swiveling domain
MTLRAFALVPGIATGPVRALTEPVSFWGGYDATTGRIIDRWHPQHGVSCAGHVLVMSASRGSSSGSSVLAEALRAGFGPRGFVLIERDAILTVGVMVARELYGVACPIAIADPADWPALCAARSISIRAEGEDALITLDEAEPAAS